VHSLLPKLYLLTDKLTGHELNARDPQCNCPMRAIARIQSVRTAVIWSD